MARVCSRLDVGLGAPFAGWLPEVSRRCRVSCSGSRERLPSGLVSSSYTRLCLCLSVILIRLKTQAPGGGQEGGWVKRSRVARSFLHRWSGLCLTCRCQRLDTGCTLGAVAAGGKGTMNIKRLVLTRDGQTARIVVRSDTPAIIGKRFKWGSGRCWTVVAIQYPDSFEGLC